MRKPKVKRVVLLVQCRARDSSYCPRGCALSLCYSGQKTEHRPRGHGTRGPRLHWRSSLQFTRHFCACDNSRLLKQMWKGTKSYYRTDLFRLLWPSVSWGWPLVWSDFLALPRHLPAGTFTGCWEAGLGGKLTIPRFCDPQLLTLNSWFYTIHHRRVNE